LKAIQSGNSDIFFLQEAGVVLESVTRKELSTLAKELHSLPIMRKA
jgi:hypothetical protein